MNSEPQLAPERPTWRLTCLIQTPAGGQFVEVLHVEAPVPEREVAAYFFGDRVGFYAQINVEPVPRFVEPVKVTADERLEDGPLMIAEGA